MDCRVAKVDNLGWRPTTDNKAKKEACEKANDCVASLIADNSCTWVLPITGSCDEICSSCPVQCRITDGDSDNMEECDGAICADCHETCMITLADIEEMEEEAAEETGLSGDCNNCPLEKRLMGADLPLSYSTGNLCGKCPVQCRITGGNPNIMEGCEEAECDTCYSECMINIIDLHNIDIEVEQEVEYAGLDLSGDCSNCPYEKRLQAIGIPESYVTGDCSVEACPVNYRAFLAATCGEDKGDCSYLSCPVDYRVFMPRNTCEECLFTEESYIYDPPINTACGEICRPKGGNPEKEQGSYSKVGQDGLVGKPDVQTLSKFMLPVYVLPLFNIVATLVFIKGLSKILGGDVEIPGLSKVF